MRRAFLTVADRQIHYRHGGEGSPVVMLHPSPLSSTALLPLASELAKHFRVYALDTPGYGLSDSPLSRPQSLDDYLPTFAAALDRLGLRKVCLYGAATGAQFAIEFSRRYPERVELMMIDSAGHIPAEECDAIVRDYFPDVTPQRDGRHLVTLWQMVRDLFVFFPWCDTRASRRIDRDLPPPEFMQTMLLDYLRAGPHYDWAYRPAFYNERAERAQAVRVPAVLTRWEGSVVLRITDALIAAGLPANYRVLNLGPSMAERIAGISAHLQERLRGEPAPPIPAASTPRHRLGSALIDVRGGQLHARMCAEGTGRPVLVLHSPAASAALVEPIASSWVGTRPVIALDLPGNGESDALLADPDVSIENYAQCAHEALDALGISELDVAGRYSGGDVGLEMSLLRSGRVRHLAFLGVPLFAAAERDELLANYTPSIAPRADGTHLISAWYMMRDQGLWFPYTRTTRAGILHQDADLKAEFIHKRVVEVMKMGDRYRRAYAAEFRYPLAERLARAGCQITLGSAAWEALRHKLAEGLAIQPRAQRLDLVPQFSGWAAQLDAGWSRHA